ncbi:histidine phosphatase family protein [Gilliamella apicola]|uniref:Histidine phosphatase family protein n=1 Tax=Gilliamella apicola TaxID=1196095 RepID=A0A556RSI6_9GAMM|nr:MULTISPECIES: histidine phosphatase family protein [Gilliamella]MBI0113524.1 histidine phosphatase family protein [Gilliamella sp. W8123]MBI0116939.1 histidine phosphatase family protein [Gilliamella sp. W8129]TSJ91861.1 histidine phosphatase family protein [Gilliamella apicola]
MKNIYFIRHAQSEANTGGITKPNKEINLTADGMLQAKKIAQNFDVIPTEIFTSEYYRTQQTAAPLLQKHHLSATVLPCLNEFNTLCHKAINGLNGEERLPITIKYWQDSIPDLRHGETAQTFNEFYQQVSSFNKEIKHIPNNSVIFGHGMWLALYIWQQLGFSNKCERATEMQLFRKFQLGLPIPNTALYHFIWNDDLQFCKLKYIDNFM